MTHARTLRRRLLSFIRGRGKLKWVTPKFAWPGGLLELSRLQLFDGFEWTRFEASHGAAVWGIREGGHGFARGEITGAGFYSESTVRYPVVPGGLAASEYYLVVELLSAERAVLSVCAFHGKGRWDVHEEHVLVRGIA